jgi:HEAT repeat protein
MNGPNWEQTRSNLIQLGPEFNQVLQILIEGLRADEGGNVIRIILAFIAEMGEQSAYVLPELFELQRDSDHPYLWVDARFSYITSGGHWDDFLLERQADGCPLSCWALHDHDDAAHLQKYLRKQGKSALRPLARYLKDPDPKLRLFAAYCADLIGPQAAELSKDLQAALADRQGFPEAKGEFARLESFYLNEMLHAVSTIGPTKNITRDVAPFLKHKSPTVQAMTVWLLSQPGIDREDALTALTQVPDDANVMVRLQVVLARLRLEGNEEKWALELNRYLSDTQEAARLQAAAGLCRIGRAARPSMDTFRRWARSTNYRERLLAAEAHWAVAGETQAAVSLCIGIREECRDDTAERVQSLLKRVGPDADPARAFINR